SGECLGCDDKQCRGRVEISQNVIQLSTIDIRNKMYLELRQAIGLQCFRDHYRTEIGTTDADIDDIGNWQTGVATMSMVLNRRNESCHLLQNCIDLWHDIDTIEIDRCIGT